MVVMKECETESFSEIGPLPSFESSLKFASATFFYTLTIRNTIGNSAHSSGFAFTCKDWQGRHEPILNIFVSNWPLRLHNILINERGGAGKTGKLKISLTGSSAVGIFGNSAPLPLIKPYRIILFSARSLSLDNTFNAWALGKWCIFVQNMIDTIQQ